MSTLDQGGGLKWRRALIAAGHKVICHKCKQPIIAGQEKKHLHDGKWYGEKV